MSEYVFKYAPGFGFDMDGQMETLPMTAREYYASNCADHYGTLHEEIVRCRDCAWYKPYHSFAGAQLDLGICKKIQYEVDENGFCACGERREQ